MTPVDAPPEPQSAPSADSSLSFLISELTKPGLTGLVIFATGAGFLLGFFQEANASFDGQSFLALIGTAIGTTLVAACSSILTQLKEADRDRRMERTKSRPLATGEVTPSTARISAVACGGFGIAIILLVTKTPVACLLAIASLVTYVWVYTPMKPRSTTNTLIGAVPGALPPLIGWAAARGELDPGAMVLFGILFLWQIPHFLAISWIYKDDYGRGGFQMLSVLDETGERTSQMAILYALTLIPMTWIAPMFGLGGIGYWCGATLLGGYQLLAAIRFRRRRDKTSARALFRASIIYLPVILFLMILDPGSPRF
ncbi:MAG: heme o synthase [Planctomycetota bacterium]